MMKQKKAMKKAVADSEDTLKLAITEQPLVIENESQCSVEINMSVKGAVAYTVKAYANSAEEARKMAVKEFKALRKEFKN